jgi:hypothetical protein
MWSCAGGRFVARWLNADAGNDRRGDMRIRTVTVDRTEMVVVMIVGMTAIDAMSDRMIDTMISDTSVDTTKDETTATTIAVVVRTMIDTIDTMIDADRTTTDGTRIATIDDAMAIDGTRGIRIATTDDGTTRRDTTHTNVIHARHLRLQPSHEIRDKKYRECMNSAY